MSKLVVVILVYDYSFFIVVITKLMMVFAFYKILPHNIAAILGPNLII